LVFMYITKSTTSKYFDENLKLSYQFLLTDPIYAIRRTAPLTLPVLVKQFGMTWAKNSLIQIRNGKFLADFKNFIEESEQSKVFLETLVKIVKLNNKLDEELKSDDSLEEPDGGVNYNELKFYAEDTLVNLKKEQKLVIFSTGLDEINDCYLEGVL
jgi:hypothetical protein